MKEKITNTLIGLVIMAVVIGIGVLFSMYSLATDILVSIVIICLLIALAHNIGDLVKTVYGTWKEEKQMKKQ